MAYLHPDVVRGSRVRLQISIDPLDGVITFTTAITPSARHVARSQQGRHKAGATLLFGGLNGTTL